MQTNWAKTILIYPVFNCTVSVINLTVFVCKYITVDGLIMFLTKIHYYQLKSIELEFTLFVVQFYVVLLMHNTTYTRWQYCTAVFNCPKIALHSIYTSLPFSIQMPGHHWVFYYLYSLSFSRILHIWIIIYEKFLKCYLFSFFFSLFVGWQKDFIFPCSS